MRFVVVAWVLASLGCSEDPTAELGGACLTTADCRDELLCFETMARGNECMAPCEEDARLCEDGEVCLAGPSGAHVCYTGGDLELDEPCADGGDCAAGLVCVSHEGASLCRQACDTRAPVCTGDTECVAIGEPAGFCTAP